MQTKSSYLLQEKSTIDQELMDMTVSGYRFIHNGRWHADESEYKYDIKDYDPDSRINVDEEVVFNCIMKAKRTVSAAPAGFRPYYFKQMFKQKLCPTA